MKDGPVALVTGGSRGIGRAIALELAQMGYRVIITCRGLKNGKNNDLEAKTVQKEIKTAGSECRIVCGDIGLAEDRIRLVERIRHDFDRCDLLVNNAGIAPEKRRDILDADESSFDRVMTVNLKGPYFLTQQIARWMIEQKKRWPDRAYHICNIGSISAYTSSPSRGEYCLSKAGMAMMTKLYGDRLAEYGIGVYEVRPGVIKTDMTAGVQKKYDQLIADGLTPIKRWGTPEDVARAVGAIARGHLDFSTGQVIDVDGGFHLRRL